MCYLISQEEPGNMCTFRLPGLRETRFRPLLWPCLPHHLFVSHPLAYPSPQKQAGSCVYCIAWRGSQKDCRVFCLPGRNVCKKPLVTPLPGSFKKGMHVLQVVHEQKLKPANGHIVITVFTGSMAFPWLGYNWKSWMKVVNVRLSITLGERNGMAAVSGAEFLPSSFHILAVVLIRFSKTDPQIEWKAIPTATL